MKRRDDEQPRVFPPLEWAGCVHEWRLNRSWIDHMARGARMDEWYCIHCRVFQTLERREL